MREQQWAQALDAAIEALQRTRGRLPEFIARRRQWQRGGFGRDSMPEAVQSSSEGFSLESDKVDQRLAADVRRFGQLVKGFRSDGAELDRILNYWLIPAPRLVEDVTPPCSNLRCDQFLEPGRKSGQCSRCRVWKHRNGIDYPYLQAEEAS